VHASLLALYGLGGWLVAAGLMPIRVLLSAIGFTFSLVFATQGCVQTFSEARRVLVCVRRCAPVLQLSKRINTWIHAPKSFHWWLPVAVRARVCMRAQVRPGCLRYNPHNDLSACTLAHISQH